MKNALIPCLLAALVLCQGCWTGPKTAVTPWALVKKGEKVVYVEQSDRIPKDVLLAAIAAAAKTNETSAQAGIQAVPYTELISMFDNLFKQWPELAEKYGNERMHNALIGRRMLFRGYDDASLTNIAVIIKAAGGTFEYITPQGAPR